MRSLVLVTALMCMLASHHGATQDLMEPAPLEAVEVKDVTYDLETMGLIWIQEGEVKRLAYVVQTGDTLWDIAARYLNSPYYWPKIWERNTFVINPHLIFPGDILYIYPEGIIEQPGVTTGPVTQVTRDLEDVDEGPRRIIYKYGGAAGFVSTEELEAAGRIVDNFDNKALLGDDDVVYVDVGKVDRVLPGDRYSIFRIQQNTMIGKIIEVKHPVTGKLIGYQVINLGELVITKVDIEGSEAVIVNSYREVQNNDLITPYLQPLEETVDLAETDVEYLKAYVVANKNNVKLIGEQDIVYIDVGADHRVMRGNIFTVYKPCELVEDTITGDLIRIPEKTMGKLVVLEPYKKTSVCLVWEASTEISYGEHVLMSKYSSWEIEGISQATEIDQCERDPKCRLITKQEYDEGVDIPFCEMRAKEEDRPWWKPGK